MNNMKNKLITEIELLSILKNHIKKQIKINNISIYHQSFLHKSFKLKDAYNDPEDNSCIFLLESSSNERLEFLGDSVLNMVTAEYLFQKFPDKEEGFLTKLRTKLVRNTQLSFIGDKLGFKKWLLISNQVERLNGRENPRLIEDVYESFIAALYKDQGFYSTREFIFSCFDTFVNIEELVKNNDNYKDTLLRFFQLNCWSHPIYNTFSIEGVGSNRTFNTTVLLSKEFSTVEIIDRDSFLMNNLEGFYSIGIGSGKTKKESEQNSSKNALEFLKVSKNF
jgi:ribonuclease-3